MVWLHPSESPRTWRAPRVIMMTYVGIQIAPTRAEPRISARTTCTKRRNVRPDIVPGGIFPDYELTDHTNTRHKLSELQGIDPVILVLSRGHFCPKDHQQHLQLAAFYPQIAAGYTRIVTIATDNVLTVNDFRKSVGAQWTFLSDADRKVQKDLDIQEYTDPHNDPMIPHTLVLKPELVIHSVYNGYWYWGRPSIEDLHRDLREVTREIRPDWDLGSPSLREDWETGDCSMHYAYKDADLCPRPA
jgi:peroxiredoxin